MIYALTADAAHIQEEDVFDAELIQFSGFEDVSFFHPGIDYHQERGAPELIEFVGNLENAGWLDHLFTTPMEFLLISKKMVSVLDSVKPFRRRLIPAVIYSKKIENLVRDKASGRRTWYQVQDPKLRNDDFVILQLVDELDCLDADRTIVGGVPFRQHEEKFLGTEEAQHLELREPEGGFPPVFFVPELLFYGFSAEAKQACDAAGLKGLWWRPQR
jgi:hypothetical protein